MLEPYHQAETTVDAERVLDVLVADGANLPVPIGDLYDELAAISWPPGRNEACWCRSGQKVQALLRPGLTAADA